MKKRLYYIAFTALILNAVTLQAQITVGAKAGVNVSQLSGLSSSEIQTKAIFGFHGGGYVQIRLGKFGIQPEILFSSQGAKLEKSNSSDNLKINYINIPVLFKLNVKPGLFFESGPQIGIAATAKYGDNDIKNTIKSSDFSWAFGLGAEGHSLGIGARYNLGISTLGNTTTNDIRNLNYKNGVLQISLYAKLFGK
jgi:hypothetical protein